MVAGCILLRALASVAASLAWAEAGHSKESSICSQGGEGQCEGSGVKGPLRLEGESQLLQTAGRLSVASSVEEGHRAPGDFGDDRPAGLQCPGLRHIERTCSANGCKVLAGGMRGRTCRQYCGDSGLSCVGAWEERNNDCRVKATMTCDQTWHHTHDLLCECAGAPIATSPARDPSKLRLVWSDEFDGSGLDAGKWSIIKAGGGFGNQELQFYSDHAANVRVEHGALKITAKCDDDHGHHYTSGKVQTRHKGDWGPGHRIEVRARMPTGQGTWPAIWMLPTDVSYGKWPNSGEIDIMEAVGCSPGKVYGTVHTGAYNHMKHTEKYNRLRIDFGAWRTYAIEWTASHISWFVDEHLYHRFDHTSHGSDKWPFDRRFYLIMNLAVGGSWGGKCVHNKPSCSSHHEFGHAQVMEVDYARVYAL